MLLTVVLVLLCFFGFSLAVAYLITEQFLKSLFSLIGFLLILTWLVLRLS